jgi:hypothetical protein
MFTNSSLTIQKAIHLAPDILQPSACEQIRDFLRSQFGEGGAFLDRFGRADLYYTSFGLVCAEALQLDLPRQAVKAYLKTVPVDTLDLIHLHCYLRSILTLRKMGLPKPLASLPSPGFLRQVNESKLVESFRHEDGYRIEHTGTSSPYASFLAVTALLSCGEPVRYRDVILTTLANFRTPDGGWSNLVDAPQGTLNAGTAAMVVLADCGEPIDERALAWLWQQFDPKIGGFYGAPGAPLPDLLSTASALTALHLAGVPWPETMKRHCQDFVLDHWHDDGGFMGNLADPVSDCEYTFYALLALGLLAT